MTTFKNAQEAFENLYRKVSVYGQPFANTLTIFNIGFEIANPLDNHITSEFRKWNPNYAEFEWQWYLSGDRNADAIAKRAPIWAAHQDEDGNVNSNYGWQWKRGDQLDYVIQELKARPNSRRASISIYDAKDRHNFERDTPCTYGVGFTIVNGKLNMTVMMRSNDLWFGFCNDQYCFSKLQEMVANEVGVPVGSYFHFAQNLHLYNDKLNKL